MTDPRFNVEQEYDTLRTEMIDGKKYVFERPLLIITIAAAIFQINTDFGIYFSVIINGLLLFNFWFTVNRLTSMSRIIAYIQVVLEDKEMDWHGWETSLRFYRKWVKENNRKITIPMDTVYDNLGFYPKIFYLHIAISIIITAVLIAFTIGDLKPINIIYDSFAVVLEIVFVIYAIRKSPSKLQPHIELNRCIWKAVMKDWNEMENSTLNC